MTKTLGHFVSKLLSNYRSREGLLASLLMLCQGLKVDFGYDDSTRNTNKNKEINT